MNQLVIALPVSNNLTPINLVRGANVLNTGFNKSSLTHFPRLSLTSITCLLRGSVTCLLIAPAKPPRLTPLLSGIPSISSLNFSVVDIIPIAEPSIAFPRIPKGPKNIVDIVAAATLGKYFLIFCFLSLFNNPPLSPNKKSFTSLLFLIRVAAAPIIAPPRGPKGRIKPLIAPAVTYFFPSGRYFCIASCIFLEIRPSFLVMVPSSFIISSPNTVLWKKELLLIILRPAPAIAPIKGPPKGNRVPRIAPFIPPSIPLPRFFFTRSLASSIASPILNPNALSKKSLIPAVPTDLLI